MDAQNRQDDQVVADRLLRAADVLMAARGRGDDSEAFVDAWLGNDDPRSGAPDRPFSYEELVEAMCFLIRCGFVNPAVPAAGARSAQRKRGTH